MGHPMHGIDLLLGSAAGEGADEVYFVLAVGGPVLAEDLVEPDCGLGEDVGSLP